MDKLVLPYLSYVQTKFCDSLVNVRVVLRRNFGRIRDFTTTFHSKNCNKDLVCERSWHIHHVVVAEGEDEQLVEERILNVLIDLGIHTAPSELHLHESPTLCKPGRRGVPNPVNLAHFNDHPLRNSIIPATYSFKVQVASHKVVLLLQLVLDLLQRRGL